MSKEKYKENGNNRNGYPKSRNKTKAKETNQ